ncbi:hypothetical protein [Luteolibacter rhizosphaerae]|uniref:hypothetical protein n=1 Tax=Luteolibacter rhizosphaerae TaxID=2989719 RepID=UPI002221B01F|nr:hypothetical protein [Luteolibacter rhizosphaerae]
MTSLCLLAALFSPLWMRRGKIAAPRTEAFNGIRLIGQALEDFKLEYGKLPDDSTIAMVREKTRTDLELGNRSSNAIFRQLIASVTKSERPFWCPTAWSKKKPDEVFTGSMALAPGEVGFAYVVPISPIPDPNIPLVLTPLIPGTTRFDPKTYGEKAIILCADGSTMVPNIQPDSGEVWVNGKNIFDPSQPFWKGQKPDIRWAETK